MNIGQLYHQFMRKKWKNALNYLNAKVSRDKPICYVAVLKNFMHSKLYSQIINIIIEATTFVS